MSARAAAPSPLVTHPRRLALIVTLLYLPLLVMVFRSTSFSAEADARRYVEQTLNRPAGPLPPMPVLKAFPKLELVLRRDPFLPIDATAAKRVETASPGAGELRFVATYREQDRACAVNRSGDGRLARWCVGDTVGGGTIRTIEATSVTIGNGGGQRLVPVAPMTK